MQDVVAKSAISSMTPEFENLFKASALLVKACVATCTTSAKVTLRSRLESTRFHLDSCVMAQSSGFS